MSIDLTGELLATDTASTSLETAVTDPCGPPRADRTEDESRAIDGRLDRRFGPSIELEVDVFAALGSETRYRILLLLEAAEGDVSVSDLEAQLAVGQSSVSRALSTLRTNGLVSRRTDGRWRYYELTPLARRLLRAMAEPR